MIISKPGNYKAIEDIKTRGTISIGTIPKGTIIEITAVDPIYHKVIGPNLFDWHYWNMPVVPIE